jgi:hypothetical protein
MLQVGVTGLIGSWGAQAMPLVEIGLPVHLMIGLPLHWVVEGAVRSRLCIVLGAILGLVPLGLVEVLMLLLVCMSK